MSIDTKAGVASALQTATSGLASLMRTSEAGIESLTRTFQELAGQASAVLGLASEIVDSIEGDGVASVLPRVQTLGAAAISFVEARLQATHGILETATEEMRLLRQLTAVTRRQSAIALKTRVLTMMTNVEVGRLGVDGTGFEYLATELAKFSKSLIGGTDELESHTAARRLSVAATQRALAAELPRLAEEFARIEVSLGDDLTAVESGLSTLAAIPLSFKSSVTRIAEGTAGAIAAVQSYDITRQQIEHVQEALQRISSGKEGRRDHIWTAKERSLTYTGITIQIYQLRHIRQTFANWTSQIRACLEGILTVSASDLMGIAPLVQEQELEISAKLVHVQLLESQSKDYSDRIRETVGEHASLAQLIDEQVKQARTVGQMLHLLSLNSIIEASRLGARANPILEIGKGISGLSAEWSGITDQSERSMTDIVKLVERIGQLMSTFSEARDEKLHDAQMQMREGLGSLRGAAAFAAGHASEIQRVLGKMRSMGAGIGKGSDAFDTALGAIDSIVSELQSVQCQLQTDHPACNDDCEMTEMEQLFSFSYTTETERDVLRAALLGSPLPPVQQMLEGNGIELF